MSEEDIKNYEVEKYAQRDKVEPNDVQGDSLTAIDDAEIWAEPVTTKSDRIIRDGDKQTIIHKVKAGETLASIAKTYEVSMEEINTTNNLRRNAVRVGQQLRINTSAPQAVMETTVAAVTKSTSSSSQSSAQKKSNNAGTSGKATSHVVKKGETLSIIAKKYGTTIAALKNANGLKNDNIRAGQKLTIPAKSTGTAKKSSSSGSKTTTKRKR